MAATTCSVCKRPIEGAEILYTTQGDLICPQCHAQKDLQQLDLRAAKNITNSAVSCLLLALLSFLFNPFFLLTIFSVSGGIYAIKSLSPSNERFARHVESKRGFIYACAIAGFMITGLRVLIILLPLAGN
jgi:hypothetical protein